MPSLVWHGVLGPYRSWSSTRGWVNEPGVHARQGLRGSKWPAESVEATGARRTSPVTQARRAAIHRAVVIGDSFAYGMEVSDDDVFTAMTERDVPGWELLNYAVPGYGQDQALLALREQGLALKPDVVVFGFVWVDLERNDTDFSFARKPRFELEAGELVLRASPVPDPETFREQDRWRIRTLDVLRALGRQWGWIVPDPGRTVALSQAIVGAIVEESRAAGARVILVYMPEPGGQGRYTDSDDAVFRSMCHDHEVTCIDLRPAFDAAADRGVRLANEQHWSPAGHRIAADALVPVLQAMFPEEAASGVP